MTPIAITRWACRLWKDRLGLSALEFGLMAPVWVTLIDVVVDFGEAFYLKMKLAMALNVACQYAFLNAQTVQSTTLAAYLTNVKTVAQTAANLSTAPTVTVLFNNAASTTNAGNYYCVSGNSPVTYSSTGTSSASCGSNVMSGKFIAITIAGSASTFFIADPFFGSTINISDTAVVRVQ